MVSLLEQQLTSQHEDPGLLQVTAPYVTNKAFLPEQVRFRHTGETVTTSVYTGPRDILVTVR